MKIRILSDLHIDVNQSRNEDFYINDDYDVALIAGDIGAYYRKYVPMFQKSFPDKKVIFNLGNHIVYNQNGLTIRDIIAECKDLYHNEYYCLEDDYLKLDDDTYIIGMTLYTDYSYPSNSNVEANMHLAEYYMNDFYYGKVLDNLKKRSITAKDYIDIHQNSKHCIQELYSKIISENPNAKIILMTHHCLHPDCIDIKYKGSILNSAFITDLSDWIDTNFPQIRLIVSGHVHNSKQFTFGKNNIKYIVNPYGYVYADETKDFTPNLIIDTKDL